MFPCALATLQPFTPCIGAAAQCEVCLSAIKVMVVILMSGREVAYASGKLPDTSAFWSGSCAQLWLTVTFNMLLSFWKRSISVGEFFHASWPCLMARFVLLIPRQLGTFFDFVVHLLQSICWLPGVLWAGCCVSSFALHRLLLGFANTCPGVWLHET